MPYVGPVVSRRRLLGTGAVAGAAIAADALFSTPALGLSKKASTAAKTASTAKPAISSLISKDKALHLARRATYGIKPSVHSSILKMGERAWVARQLDPSKIPDSACEGYLERYPLIGLDSDALSAKVSVGSYDQMNQMTAAYLVRATWSNRQLYEMMVEFWWNHFNIGLPDSDVWNLCGSFDNVIRRHALGTFEDMLTAVANSPAMLIRLNQNQSVGTNPNENYAREMLELHTVGVGAGYTQTDVHHASLLLTGWGLDSTNRTFQYTAANHYVGALKVMGFSTANSSATGGEAVIKSYLSYLAHHPDTASHLATELAVRFVSDDPPASLVEKLATTYLDNDTAIAPVLTELFASDEFAASIGQKVRRPIEAVAASLRILDYQLKNDETADLADLVFSLEIMGQMPLGWPQPNGYPDTATAWTSASFFQSIWGVHMRLTGSWWTETLTFPGWSRLLDNPSESMTAGDLVDAVTNRLLAQQVTEDHKQMFLEYMGFSEDQAVGAEGLAWLPLLTKVVLDSPYFAVR